MAAFVYVRTLLPGVSFGDWADAQLNPYRLGIMHPTGYPLFVLLGKLFTLIPAGSVAWRMNLLSAMAAAAVVGVAVLIMVRLGIRPVIAAAAGLALAFTGTLWQEATFSEMNSLHLLLVALLLHRALVWRASRRPRDLVLGAFIGGLCVSNHGLAITVVPIVVLFVLVDARRELARNPWLLVRSGGAFVLGLVPYLQIPIRASFGPADVYGPFLTWDGFFAHVSGAQFRSAMHFLSPESIGAAAAAMPGVVDDILSLSNVVFLVAGIIGLAILLLRDRWFGLLLDRPWRDQRVLLRELQRRPVALPADQLADPRDRAGAQRGDPGPRPRPPDRAAQRGRRLCAASCCRSSCSPRTTRPTTSPRTPTASGSRPRSSRPCRRMRCW